MKLFVRLALCSLAVCASAQQLPTFSKNVNVVNLFASVHDRNGRIVNNLTAGDFVLKEDGAPQTIRYFSQESNLPLTVGLLVDTSRSQQDVLGQEISASKTFLGQVLRPQDQAFISHFDIRVETPQGLTSSHQDLAAALDELSIPGQIATLLFSGVEDASNNILHGQSGRKAVILLTDGVAWRDPVSMDAAIAAAQRADTIIFSIRFSGPMRVMRPVRVAVVAGLKEHGKSNLQEMADATGGSSWEVKGDRTLASIYSAIEDELRNQYSIGYDPGRAAPDGKFHHIQLTTKDKKLIVTTRAGYYAQ
jgi:VWFA-related protein